MFADEFVIENWQYDKNEECDAGKEHKKLINHFSEEFVTVWVVDVERGGFLPGHSEDAEDAI